MAPLPAINVPPVASTAIANITALRITIYLLQFLLCLLFLHALPRADRPSTQAERCPRATNPSSHRRPCNPPKKKKKRHDRSSCNRCINSHACRYAEEEGPDYDGFDTGDDYDFNEVAHHNMRT